MITEFSERMKTYEKEMDYAVDTSKYVVMRLDWHGFSKFTKWFARPFDDRILNAMILTAEDVMLEFNAVTAFTQSDEITLIFEPSENFIFNGRLSKLLSLTAWLASARFNFYLDEENKRFLGTDTDKSEKLGNAYFDSRIMSMPSDTEAFNMFLWRTKDCMKNSKNTFSQTYVSHKSLQWLTAEEWITLCNEETGNDWNKLDDVYKYGCMIKKENYELSPDVVRTRTIRISQQYFFNDECIELALCKRLGI